MNFLSGQDEFRRGQDDFFQTANQPISVRHLCLPYNKKFFPVRNSRSVTEVELSDWLPRGPYHTVIFHV